VGPFGSQWAQYTVATLQLPRCTYEKEKKRKENSESVNVVEIYSGL
jgi:hypothetical protein